MRIMSSHPVCTKSAPTPARRKIRVGVVFAILCLAATACSTEQSRRPKGATKPLPAAESRLIFNLPALAAATPEYHRYTSADGRFVEEFATWAGGSDDPIAGLLISEAVDSAPLLDAESPERTVDLWSELRDKKPGFGPLKQMPTGSGPRSWGRASIGTRICVVFLQRPGAASGDFGRPRASLTGYYCNPPGASLGPDAAEAAVKSAGLRGHAPPQ